MSFFLPLVNYSRERQAARAAAQAGADTDYALVQFSNSLEGGAHVPCRLLYREKDGRLRVQVVGCEPHDLAAREAGPTFLKTPEGPRLRWTPGTVHKRDDCAECARSRR